MGTRCLATHSPRKDSSSPQLQRIKAWRASSDRSALMSRSASLPLTLTQNTEESMKLVDTYATAIMQYVQAGGTRYAYRRMAGSRACL